MLIVVAPPVSGAEYAAIAERVFVSQANDVDIGLCESALPDT